MYMRYRLNHYYHCDHAYDCHQDHSVANSQKIVSASLAFGTKSCSIGIEDDDEFGKSLAALLRTRFDAVITRVHCQL